MSKMGEWFAWNLNQVFPHLAIHRELEIAKLSIEANQKWAYEEAKRIAFAFDPYWDIRNKDVLDIGGGFGGKLPYYLEQGVNSLVEIDVDYQSIKTIQQSLDVYRLDDQARTRVKLAVSDGATLPFPSDSFDTIIAINVFEHIIQFEQALLETFRVLKPGGLAFIHLPPYYSAWGPHLENWIHYPWPHLFFSEKTLMRVAAREDEKRKLSSQFIQPAHQIDWLVAGDKIPEVNHVTLRSFRRLVSQTGFSVMQLKLLPIGYNRLQNNPTLINKIINWSLKLSASIPLIQEITVTKMVFVLKKDLHNE